MSLFAASLRGSVSSWDGTMRVLQKGELVVGSLRVGLQHLHWVPPTLFGQHAMRCFSGKKQYIRIRNVILNLDFLKMLNLSKCFVKVTLLGLVCLKCLSRMRTDPTVGDKIKERD